MYITVNVKHSMWLRTGNSAIADKTRDAFIVSVKITKHGTIRYVRYGFILVCYSNFVRKTHRFFEIFGFKNAVTLKNQVRDPWRSLKMSLKMSPFRRQPMTSYWCCIVTMALSRVVSEIFNVEKNRDLEIPVNGQSWSLKVVAFDRLDMVSY